MTAHTTNGAGCGCRPVLNDPCCGSSDRLTVKGRLDVVYPPFVAGAEGELVQVRERECQRTQPEEYDPDVDPYYWE